MIISVYAPGHTPIQFDFVSHEELWSPNGVTIRAPGSRAVVDASERSLLRWIAIVRIAVTYQADFVVVLYFLIMVLCANRFCSFLRIFMCCDHAMMPTFLLNR